MNYKDFGARIRAARRGMGLTQEELAERTNISASFLGHIERGTRVASLETLVALCNELHVSADFLLTASLDFPEDNMPEELSANDRAKLSEFLTLAQETIRNWNKPRNK